MLHKVSSLKIANVSQSNQTNWQSVRKEMGSPKSINMISSTNINDKIGQIVKVIQQERINRQKDIALLCQKIKSSKCKHQVVYVQSKEIEDNKNVKDRNKSVDQNGMISKRGSAPQNAENQSSSIKDLSVEKLLKQNRNFKVSLEKISEQCSANSSKIEELQKIIQSTLVSSPKDFHSDKFSLLDQQISDIKVQCQQIPHILLELDLLKSSQTNLEVSEFQSELKIKLEHMDNKIYEIEESMLENFNNSESRTIQQISTLGAIVDRNLQAMYQDILNDCHSEIGNIRKQFNDKTDNLQSCQLGDRLSALQKHTTQKISKIESSISLNQNSCALVAQNLSLLEHKNLKLQQNLDMNFNKMNLIEKQCSLIQTKSSISNQTNLDDNSSIIIFNDERDQQKSISTQKRNLPFNECVALNGLGLQSVVEVFQQNCSYLESRNIALEEHLGELVQVVNHVLSKFQIYA